MIKVNTYRPYHRYLPISKSPHGHGAAAVELTRDDCAISVRFHGYCTGTERQPCDNCATAVRMSHDFTIAVRLVFGNMTTENRAFAARSERGVRTTPVRGLCNGRYDMSTGYGLTIFKNLYNFLLYKIVETAMPVNPYKNLTATACLRTEAARKGRFGQSALCRLRRHIVSQM